MKLGKNLNLTFQKELENKFLNANVPNIRVGDTIKLGVSITEGNKERIQFTEGVVIAKKNSSLNSTITLRRVMQGCWCRESLSFEFTQTKEHRNCEKF